MLGAEWIPAYAGMTGHGGEVPAYAGMTGLRPVVALARRLDSGLRRNDGTGGEIPAYAGMTVFDFPPALRYRSHSVGAPPIYEEAPALLDLNDLGRNFGPGLASAKGQDLADAGSVCLEERGHSVGVRLRVEGDASVDSHELRWLPVTEQLRLTHGDIQEATELGAAGIAILLTARETGHSVLRRAAIGDGVDYWLGDSVSVQARLEASGILHGDSRRISARVSQKIAQTARSVDAGLPVYVVVVEFSAPSARFHEVKP